MAQDKTRGGDRAQVLVAGGTGVLGRCTVAMLRQRGYDPVVLARNRVRAAALLGPEIRIVEGDVLIRSACMRAADGCQAVLHLATAIPRGSNRDWSLNDRIRTEGTENLLAAARSVGARQYIQQSIVFIYRDSGERWLDEESPLDPPPHLRSAEVMEQIVRAAREPPWMILRGGSFYGTGTGTTEDLLRGAREGSVAIDPDADGYISPIHVRDMAAAVLAALANAEASTVYNVVDDEPVRNSHLIQYLAKLMGGPLPPIRRGPGRRSLRVSNARLRELGGWQPAFPTFREGYRAVLEGSG